MFAPMNENTEFYKDITPYMTTKVIAEGEVSTGVWHLQHGVFKCVRKDNSQKIIKLSDITHYQIETTGKAH